MQRHIYNSCLGAYPPADEYGKPFYCLAHGLNMKSEQIHRNILNIEMNMRESTIGRNILNILKDCQRMCGDFGLCTNPLGMWLCPKAVILKHVWPLIHSTLSITIQKF